jgi:hypothetical protein
MGNRMFDHEYDMLAQLFDRPSRSRRRIAKPVDTPGTGTHCIRIYLSKLTVDGVSFLYSIGSTLDSRSNQDSAIPLARSGNGLA